MQNALGDGWRKGNNQEACLGMLKNVFILIGAMNTLYLIFLSNIAKKIFQLLSFIIWNLYFNNADLNHET